MKESTRNFVTGILSIIGLVGFAFLLLLFGDFNQSMRGAYPITIAANQALGLRTGSPVTLVGVRIGEVKQVEVLIDNPLPVRITAEIDESFDIPAGVEAAVTNSLIGGTARLDLSIPPDYAQGGATLPRDGNALITAKLEALEARIARLLEEKLGGLESAMQSVTSLATSVTALAKDAQKWLGDEQLLADAKSSVWKAQTLIENASGTMIALQEAARAIQGNAEALTQSIQPAFDQLSLTLAQVENLTKQANEGKGTVGQLMSNPDLYNSLNDSAQRLKSTLGEVDLLMQKIRAEGLGVKF
ncbi:MAG: MCE family protein [Phycisphaerales bacterium]|nr:MCE family protein [Phycisphaerales bacterium]